MILKSVVTEEGFQSLVNFLNSAQNELWTGMFLLGAEYGGDGKDPSDLLILSVSTRPSPDGSTSTDRVVAKGDKIKLARLVSSGAFQVERFNSFTSGHEVVLEIGQKISHQEVDPFGQAEHLDVDIEVIMNCLQPLFEILCQFSVEEKKA